MGVSDEKMDALMARRAAKQKDLGIDTNPRPRPKPAPAARGTSRRGQPVDAARLIEAWEMDDRPATLFCPSCKQSRNGHVPKKFWWNKSKDADPSWDVICTPCSVKEDGAETKKRTPQKKKPISESPPQLTLPNEYLRPV